MKKNLFSLFKFHSVRICAPLFLLLAISSCVPSGDDVFIELPFGKHEVEIIVDSDMEITKNHKGTRFIVKPNATLSAFDYILDGRNESGGSFVPVTLIGNAKLIGGDIRYGRGGVSIRPSGLPSDWKHIMASMSQDNRLGYINSLRNKTSGCAEISKTKIYQSHVGIYVNMLNKCANISDVEITNGRLGIYHDAYSTSTFVRYSKFKDIGKNYYSSTKTGGLFLYKSSRENVAIDGSSFNNYRDNVFLDGESNAINIYVNCGEKDQHGIHIPREEAAVKNEIHYNTFIGFNTAIWESSRYKDRKTYPCISDDKGDRVSGTIFKGNDYINVGVGIKRK